MVDCWKSAALQGLRAHADDPEFRARWAQVKNTAKAKAMARIQELTGEALPADALLDIQARQSLLPSNLGALFKAGAPRVESACNSCRQMGIFC